jgi:hypothetical protein
MNNFILALSHRVHAKVPQNFSSYLVISFYVLYLVILLITPRYRSVVAITSGVLLIPSGDRADRSLLPQLRISDIIGSLSLIMLVHLSKLELELFVGDLRAIKDQRKFLLHCISGYPWHSFGISYLRMHDG